ncbi:DUF3662 domain-containing protein [Rhodococcus sp. BP-252]|uniref:DUF3662 and FHA domain-containing protein n=1 Tax=unclassified Rhodococcus (in: high G+C Gram-positive bacteria) TaxID=192944 RepID=UPI001C9B186A|nr:MULTISPECIES: DUF3662 and FHA domain-containing protein [unclassified Rhodococcus (in: high G+C Gram-positive bacteria)]MBY6411901.1 DUF3662 domain-containing protein [Rhodococcus sp. BP-320]MBY6416471.1 DUF3662 domain-containing protein [Rhodococcus sp. BP-321]MBY6420723.1 DUF3662 domain-containing protein [Rhodococcus sp. BP-324]MBY6426495.1 DUF3662 domain-containing protein [Rhodococcus sp. BP-323]MBY6431494.1 DUF3662 domain-containing protein [Rhodococcus sp. BP-322]
MGIVQRFERKLQGAVGDVFARVFGGGVVPQEVEAALQQEASDRVTQLESGHYLAPNSYVITINSSDHDELAADRDLTVKAFSRHLGDYIRDQGWQTYGDVAVRFEPSPTLHTGQFRASGSVDPDVGRSPTATARPPRPSAPPQSTSGAGPMTQNPGYDPNRDPADGSRQDPRSRGGYPAPGQDSRYAQQNGYDAQGRDQGYRNGTPYPGNAPQDDRYDPQSYDQGSYERGYDQQAYGQQAYSDQNYADQGYGQQAYPEQNYGQQAYEGQGYADQGYGQQAYSDQNYDQTAYEGQRYDQQGRQGYQQQPSYDYPPQPQGGYQQGGYRYDEPTYGDSQGLTATLQLEDGSGRYFQLRDGQNIIGRGQDAQFRLPDTGVSRRHVEIRWDGRVAMLSDLGSTNGTTVNGAPVQDWQLADGDVIRAGHSEILVRIV